jgi:hypothetical protein
MPSRAVPTHLTPLQPLAAQLPCVLVSPLSFTCLFCTLI